MARISGINIPDNKKVEIALTYVYGVGLTRSKLILNTTGVDKDKKTKDLTSEEINKIQNVIDNNYKVKVIFEEKLLTILKD